MTETPNTVEIALARLLAISGEFPGMGEAVDYYMRLVPALHAASARITPPALAPDASQKKINAGIPLLMGEAPGMDPFECRAVFRDICFAGSRTAAASQPVQHTSAQGTPDYVFPSQRGRTGYRNQAIRRIIAKVDSGELDPFPLLSAMECGDTRPAAAAAVQLGLDPGLLELMAQNTLKAFLRALRAGLEKQVNLEDWHYSQCPFCGSPPALAEAQGVERARHLRCLRCGADWPYANLRCAFCGNDDYRALGILHIEGKVQTTYVHTCDRCKRYIKTIITFEPTPVDLLIVEDLATLHLDRLAVEKGYR